MRTTLTLDDDVATRLRRLAERRRESFRKVVNAVLRSGLSRQEPSRKPSRPFRVRTFRSVFRPGVDPLRLNSLNDGLEVRGSTGERS